MNFVNDRIHSLSVCFFLHPFSYNYGVAVGWRTDALGNKLRCLKVQCKNIALCLLCCPLFFLTVARFILAALEFLIDVKWYLFFSGPKRAEKSNFFFYNMKFHIWGYRITDFLSERKIKYDEEAGSVVTSDHFDIEFRLFLRLRKNIFQKVFSHIFRISSKCFFPCIYHTTSQSLSLILKLNLPLDAHEISWD